MAETASLGTQQKGVLRFRGGAHFRQRLSFATLSGKRIIISQIRSDDQDPGLKDYEISFLRLMDKLTNGSLIEINETGTQIKYKPGVIVGGKIEHTCPLSRGISYFIEGILPLLPFGKVGSAITLTGLTNSHNDISVDLIRTVMIPLVSKFGVEMDLKINKRGAPPNGGGEVFLTAGTVRELNTVDLIDCGTVKRIRGIAFSTRVTPQTSNRIVDSTKKALKPFTSNIYVNTDHYKGKESGLSPGFGLSVVAESTTGALYSTDVLGEGGMLPERVGEIATEQLLAEILRGGYVDSTHQAIILLFMALCPEDVSRIRLGELSEYTIDFLRHIKDFFGKTFKIVKDKEDNTVLLSCLGVGYKNYSKKIF